MSGALRLGTRRSVMATTQSQQVADALTAATGRRVELVGVTTHGDVSKAALAQIGGTGVFVTEIRDRLRAGEIDFAVHSLKDLPTRGPADLVLAAVPPRDEPWDALIARDHAKLVDLPSGARVGTGSPRRIAQLRQLRPDLSYLPIRGNADTRLGKIAAGELDAVVLAYAGLRRLGRADEVSEIFDAEQMLPAPGQGALAVECRADRGDLIDLLSALDDPATRTAITAERGVLAALEAGCSAPVGAHATLDEEDPGLLRLTATVLAPDGSSAMRQSTTGPAGSPAELGRALASGLLARGAGTLMGERGD